MKFIKTLAISAIAALCLGTAAQAQTVTFRITGSTAFKGQVHLAIMHALGSSDGTSLPVGSTYGYVGSSLSGANAAIFKGFMTVSGTANTSVTIKTSWSGSEAGIQAVAAGSGAGLNVDYLLDGTPTSQLGTGGATDPTSATNQDFFKSDACMSDTLQATSQFAGGKTVNSVLYATLAGVNSSSIGVTYFAFYTTKTGKADGIANITAEQALTLYKAGILPVSFLTGSASSTGSAYAFGRNPDSGTRLTTMGEIGDGNLGGVKQYYPYDSTNTQINGTIGVLWSYVKQVPISTVNGITIAQANGGYSSGGNLAKSLDGDDSSFRLNSSTGTTQAPGSCGICYAGISDGANLSGDQGKQMTYNGVAATDLNVENGSYPLWTYEHMYLSPNITANGASVGNSVATLLQGGDAAGTGCISLGSMLVQRATDGGSQITSGNSATGNGN